LSRPLEATGGVIPRYGLISRGDYMPLENHHVFFEPTPGLSLPETMRQVRPWLEQNGIEPIAFKHATTTSGAIELQFTFKTRREASLFEQAFCRIDQV
jgi:hypothetical protein